MRDYNNSTSQDISEAYGNITHYEYEDGSTELILDVVTYVIIAAGFLSVLVAIYAVFSLVRKDNAAPIFIINLLIADLIQLCAISVWITATTYKIWETFHYLYYFVVLASVGFMMCISLERYLVISCPLWYRFRRTIKIYLMVCVGVWALPVVICLLLVYFRVNPSVASTVFGVFLLLPFPLLIFSLGGTLKALSASISVPPDEKRRIVAMLVLVLLIYTLLFLPSTILSLAEHIRENCSFSDLSFTIVQLSPIADCFLYILLRKGAVDKVLASVCCRMESNDINRSTELVNSKCSAVI